MFIEGLRLSEMMISLSVTLPWHPLMKGRYRGKSLHLKILVWGRVAQLVARVEICRDRHNRRSCKISASCVNFSGKQSTSFLNLLQNMIFTHLLGKSKHMFSLQLLKFYIILISISTKQRPKLVLLKIWLAKQ